MNNPHTWTWGPVVQGTKEEVIAAIQKDVKDHLEQYVGDVIGAVICVKEDGSDELFAPVVDTTIRLDAL